jgi:hypothetical protein
VVWTCLVRPWGMRGRKWFLCTFLPSLILIMWEEEAMHLTLHVPSFLLLFLETNKEKTTYLRFRPNGPNTLIMLILLPLGLMFSSFGLQARPRLSTSWNILSGILVVSSKLHKIREIECEPSSRSSRLHYRFYSNLMVDRRLVYRIGCRRLRRAIDLRLRSWLMLSLCSVGVS